MGCAERKLGDAAAQSSEMSRLVQSGSGYERSGVLVLIEPSCLTDAAGLISDSGLQLTDYSRPCGLVEEEERESCVVTTSARTPTDRAAR